MSIQHHAINTGANAQIWMLDLETGERTLMDYVHGAEAFERHPERYRPAGMTDAEHAAYLAARKAA